MKADPSALTALLHLQQVDIDAMRAQKKLDKLPQREAILGLRKKRLEIEPKQVQVEKMRLEADQKFAKITDEDARLIEKQQGIQEKIDQTQGDFRAIDSLTKELGGVAKRRNTLESETATLTEHIEQISLVQDQVSRALKLLDKQENEAILSFQEEGGVLNNEIARLQSIRKKLSKQVGEELLALYEKRSKKGGGIGVARVKEGACSVCRNQIDEGKLLQIRAEAPLSECPACKRILVIVND